MWQMLLSIGGFLLLPLLIVIWHVSAGSYPSPSIFSLPPLVFLYIPPIGPIVWLISLGMGFLGSWIGAKIDAVKPPNSSVNEQKS